MDKANSLPGAADGGGRAARLEGGKDGTVHAQQERLSIVVIEPRALTRQCLRLCLEHDVGRFRTLALASSDELEHRAAGVGAFDLLLLSIGPAQVAEPQIAACVRRLTAQFADIPVVVLGDGDDADDVVEAIRQGARGYVSTDLDLTEVVEALRFVLAGGTFVPARALLEIASLRTAGSGGDRRRGADGPFGGLTRRERDVLGQLRQGKPNKVIAYQLGIREATVKVFVRRILAKLNATNRTEVAYLTRRQFDDDRMPPV